ncbi:MAG: hypothetical protein AAGA99_26330 [Actinomycetota bacterium]
MTERRTCFFITPIGQPDSPQRLRADGIEQGILRPVVESEEFDLVLIRGDKIDDVGTITRQVVRAIADAAVVVADVIAENGNVYYELGIADALGRPVIRIGDPDAEPVPFDATTERIIPLSLREDGVIHVIDSERCKKAVGDQLRTVLAPGYVLGTVVTAAGVLARLDDPSILRRADEQVADSVNELARRFGMFERAISRLADGDSSERSVGYGAGFFNELLAYAELQELLHDYVDGELDREALVLRVPETLARVPSHEASGLIQEQIDEMRDEGSWAAGSEADSRRDWALSYLGQLQTWLGDS